MKIRVATLWKKLTMKIKDHCYVSVILNSTKEKNKMAAKKKATKKKATKKKKK